jgi:hypothetical protein
MRMNKIFYLMPIIMLILLSGFVSAAITISTPPTNGSILRNDVSVTATVTRANNVNTTISLYTYSGDTLVDTKLTAGNTSTLSITYNTLSAQQYYLLATSNNGTTLNSDSTYFTVTGCNNQSYAIWGILLLIFIVGLLYFVLTGFMSGEGTGLSFILAITIAAVLIGTFVLPLLRPLC